MSSIRSGWKVRTCCELGTTRAPLTQASTNPPTQKSINPPIMSDTEKGVKIKIEGDAASLVTASGQGADAIKKLEGTTGELGKETEKAAGNVRLFHTEGREMHRVIGELNRISPVLGEALRIAMHPIGGTIAAAIGLFVLMKEHIKQVNKELDDMAAKNALPDFLAGIQAKTDSLRTAGDAAQDYAAKLLAVADGEHSLTAELTAQLALQKSIQEAKTAQAGAEEALALAKIKAQVGSGAITPEMGMVQSAEVKRQAIADESRAKQAAQDKELRTKNRTIEQLDPEGDADYAKTQRAAFEAEKARRDLVKGLYGDEKKLKEDQAADEKSMTPAQAKLARLKQVPFAFDPIERAHNEKLVNEQQAEVDRIQGGMNLRQSGRGRFEADQKSEPGFHAQEIRVKAAEDAADKSTAAFAKLADEIAALSNSISANRGTDNATVKTKQATVTAEEDAELSKTPAGKAVNDAEQIAKQLHAGTATNDEAQQLVEIESRIAGHQVNLATAVQMADAAANNAQAFVTHVQRLAAALEKFKPADVKAFEERIKRIEEQLRASARQY